MIGYIKGTVEEIFEDCIMLETGGMGFRIFIPAMFRNSLDYGDDLKVYTYMNVKEDSITLFGFPSRDELDVYRLLITVNGVGPKAAMNILSIMSADELKMAVLSSDEKKIAGASGIGKKTAQKILLELKDKFDFEETVETALSGAASAEGGPIADTVEALAALGYSKGEAVKAAKKAAEAAGLADPGVLLKQALKFLF